MMSRRTLTSLALVAIACTWILSGCGRDRVVGPQSAPSNGVASNSIQFLRQPTGPEPMSWGGHQKSASVFIRSRDGGQVQCGRYTLTFPPGALPQDTTITIQDAGDGYLHCVLKPHGIQFLVPVQLQMNLDGINVSPYTDWTIFWHNDANGKWEDQHAVFTSSSLTASLHHFSDYQGGRAGW